MNDLEFLSSIIQSLAWPVSVILIIFIISKLITEIVITRKNLVNFDMKRHDGHEPYRFGKSVVDRGDVLEYKKGDSLKKYDEIVVDKTFSNNYDEYLKK